MKKLHLGCGDKILPNFTNIDIRPMEGVDVVEDISTLKKIKTNSVELIYACHVLEHFGRHEYINVLTGWLNLRCGLYAWGKTTESFENYKLNYDKNNRG